MSDRNSDETLEEAKPEKIKNLKISNDQIDCDKYKLYNIRTSNFLKFDENECPDPSLPPRDSDGNFVVRWGQSRPHSSSHSSYESESKLESNARLVEWSDGTLQIVVGEQIYNLTKDSLPKTNFLFFREPRKNNKEVFSYAAKVNEQLIVHKSRDKTLNKLVTEKHKRVTRVAKILPEKVESCNINTLRRQENRKIREKKRAQPDSISYRKQISRIELTNEFLENDEDSSDERFLDDDENKSNSTAKKHKSSHDVTMKKRAKVEKEKKKATKQNGTESSEEGIWHSRHSDEGEDNDDEAEFV